MQKNTLLKFIMVYASSNKEKLKKVLPLCVVFISAVVVALLLYSSLSGVGNLNGLFILYGSDENSFIKFDDGGSYNWSHDGTIEEGNWEFKADKIILTSSNDSEKTAKLIEHKYIVFTDENFLLGEIPSTAFFDAEVKSDNGEAYTFKSDGKIYVLYDGRTAEYGTYMKDGNFIIVTTKTDSITYLNCKNGITDVFYKVS